MRYFFILKGRHFIDTRYAYIVWEVAAMVVFESKDVVYSEAMMVALPNTLF